MFKFICFVDCIVFASPLGVIKLRLESVHKMSKNEIWNKRNMIFFGDVWRRRRRRRLTHEMFWTWLSSYHWKLTLLCHLQVIVFLLSLIRPLHHFVPLSSLSLSLGSLFVACSPCLFLFFFFFLFLRFDFFLEFTDADWIPSVDYYGSNKLYRLPLPSTNKVLIITVYILMQ